MHLPMDFLSFTQDRVVKRALSGAGLPGIGFALAVLLSMFLALAAQAQTDSSSGTSSTVPTLTIVSSSATATEGDEVTYTVTASSAPSSALPVVVHVRAHGETTDTRTVAEVLLPAGATTVTLRLEEFTDEIDESPVNVTLTLAGGTGYSVGDPSEATVSIDYPSISDALATPTPTPTPAVSPPDAPSGVSISVPTINSFTVSWTAETGKTYRVEREAAFLFSYSVWQTVTDNPSGGTFTESGLPCGLFYVYRVRAKAVGSAYSDGTKVVGPAQSCTAVKTTTMRGVRTPNSPVRKLRLVTDNPTETSIQIRLLFFHNPADESDGTYSPVFGMKKYRVDRTQRVDPSSGLLPEHWPDPTSNPNYRMERTESEFHWTGLHCGSNYFFRALGHGNGADFLHDWGNIWSNAVHGSTRGCTKPQVDVIPLPQRRARLRWGSISGASSYDVRVAKPGEAMGDKVPEGCNASYAATANATAYQCDIPLDNIIGTDGLDDVDTGEGFRVRVTVNFSDTTKASQYSDVIIVDSPIRSVNGDSRGLNRYGKMVVKWNPAGSNAQYTVRWRPVVVGDTLAPNLHDNYDWQPTAWELTAKGTVRDWKSKTTTDLHYTVGSSDEDGVVVMGLIYAVQLNYVIDEEKYFSARERYAWVSNRRGGYGLFYSGERVGSFPLNFPLDDPLAPNDKTYAYRTCTDTFAQDTDRGAQWEALIDHAFDQWERATDGLVALDHALDEDGNKAPCTDFTELTQRIRDRVIPELLEQTTGTIDLSPIRQELLEIIWLYTDLIDEDWERSEIILVDDVDGHVAVLFHVGAFPELAEDLGFNSCIFLPKQPACSKHTRYDGNTTTDIFLRRSLFLASISNPEQYDPLIIPSVKFNKCSTEKSAAYYTLVHEAGHALGIREGRGRVPDPGLIDHPKSMDSVMSFEHNPYCSPHPLDIMAIHALYQTLPE